MLCIHNAYWALSGTYSKHFIFTTQFSLTTTYWGGSVQSPILCTRTHTGAQRWRSMARSSHEANKQQRDSLHQGTWPQNPLLATRLWCLYVERKRTSACERGHVFQSGLSGQDGPGLHTWAWKMGQAAGPASCRLTAARAPRHPAARPSIKSRMPGIHYAHLMMMVPEPNLNPATQDVTHF